MPGIIKLVGPQGGTIKEAYYFRPSDMKEFIERWRRIYKVKFDKYFIHVRPKLMDERCLNGKNKK